jgi:hypothetical protein
MNIGERTTDDADTPDGVRRPKRGRRGGLARVCEHVYPPTSHGRGFAAAGGHAGSLFKTVGHDKFLMDV